MASHCADLSSGPASRYAAALYSYAADLNRVNPVSANIERLGELIDGSSELCRLLSSPLVPSADAHKALRAIVRTQELGMILRRLIDVLIANRRLPLLRSVVGAFKTIVAEKRGITTVRVASAHELTDVQSQQIRARLIELGYGAVQIEHVVEPELLGGMVIMAGVKLFDSSLRSRLQRLQYSMKGAV